MPSTRLMTEEELKALLQQLRIDLDDLSKRVSLIEANAPKDRDSTQRNPLGGFLAGLNNLIEESGYIENLETEKREKERDRCYYQFPVTVLRVSRRHPDPIFTGQLVPTIVFSVSFIPHLLQRKATSIEGHFTFKGPNGSPAQDAVYTIKGKLLPDRIHEATDVSSMFIEGLVEQQWFLRANPAQIEATFYVNKILYEDNGIEVNKSYVPGSCL